MLDPVWAATVTGAVSERAQLIELREAMPGIEIEVPSSMCKCQPRRPKPISEATSFGETTHASDIAEIHEIRTAQSIAAPTSRTFKNREIGIGLSILYALCNLTSGCISELDIMIGFRRLG